MDDKTFNDLVNRYFQLIEELSGVKRIRIPPEFYTEHLFDKYTHDNIASSSDDTGDHVASIQFSNDAGGDIETLGVNLLMNSERFQERITRLQHESSNQKKFKKRKTFSLFAAAVGLILILFMTMRVTVFYYAQ